LNLGVADGAPCLDVFQSLFDSLSNVDVILNVLE